eukprot:gb/GFBE01046848.1/.p1 GENE.gb/GFBE01046848.1/~~gb/GFBE01046848.1/.p1  ORF type:complete len:107 (+),score=44.57 gb/GFBE01046848.1/:1-321(+)
MASAGQFVIFVSFEVKKDFLEEFHRIMAIDAAETRKEEGCLRFDLLKVQGSDTKFCLYEAYKDEASAKQHANTEHYKMWNEFKTAKCGVVEGSYSKVVCDALDFQS